MAAASRWRRIAEACVARLQAITTGLPAGIADGTGVSSASAIFYQEVPDIAPVDALGAGRSLIVAHVPKIWQPGNENAVDRVGYGVGLIWLWRTNQTFGYKFDEFLQFGEIVQNRMLPTSDTGSTVAFVQTTTAENGPVYDARAWRANYSDQNITFRYWCDEDRQSY